MLAITGETMARCGYDDVELFNMIKEMLGKRDRLTLNETRYLFIMYYKDKYTEKQAEKIAEIYRAKMIEP